MTHADKEPSQKSQPSEIEATTTISLFSDNRPSFAAQLAQQKIIHSGSQTQTFQRATSATHANTGAAVIQAVLWTEDEFTNATTFNKTLSSEPRERKSIVPVDQALKAVHDNRDPLQRPGLLQTLIQRIDAYLEGKILGEKHTSPFEWRGSTDKSNQRIDPVLTLKNQVLEELRGGRNQVNGVNWDLHDQMVQNTDDLARLKVLVSQRFGLPVAEIGAVPVGGYQVGDTDKVVTPHDWTAKGLKRAYQALTGLPLSHTEANASFGKLLRYEGGGGYFSDPTATVAIGTKDSTLNNNFSGGTFVGVTGANSFDWTVRHEVGHAVADKVGAVDGYCATDNGGHWINYGHNQEVNFVAEVFQCSNGIVHAILNEGVAAGSMKNAIAQALKKEITKDQAIAEIMRFAPHLPVNHAVTALEIAADAGWGVITGNLEAVWQGGNRLTLGGRSFVKSSERGFASFRDANFANKVSAYQFRSPHEWFAEAYAAYHDPRAAKGTLLAVDPTTRGHIAGL